MKVVYIESENARQAFAMRAAECFRKNQEIHTFTDSGDIVAGELFAVRWGIMGQSIAVFEVGESFDPLIYAEMGCGR